MNRAGSFSRVVFLSFSACIHAEHDEDTWGANQKAGAMLGATDFFLEKLGKGLNDTERKCMVSCPSVEDTVYTVDRQWNPERKVNGSVDFISTMWGLTDACKSTKEIERVDDETVREIQQNATESFQCVTEHPETCRTFTEAFKNVTKYCSCPCAEPWLRGSVHFGEHGGIDKLPLDSPHLPETCRVLNEIMACVKIPQNFCACNGFWKKKVQRTVKTSEGTVKTIEQEVWEADGEIKDDHAYTPPLRPSKLFIDACTEAGQPLLWLLDEIVGIPKPNCSGLVVDSPAESTDRRVEASSRRRLRTQIEEPVVLNQIPTQIEEPLLLV